MVFTTTVCFVKPLTKVEISIICFDSANYIKSELNDDLDKLSQEKKKNLKSRIWFY